MHLLTQIKSLADETRLRIFSILRTHELRVSELVEVMEMGQSRISRHLKILTEAGLLRFRRDGLWVFYTVNREGGAFCEMMMELMEADDSIFNGDMARAQRVLEERSSAATRFFDSRAGEWDGMRRDILGSLDLEGEILGRMGSVEVAADLGCGAGHLLEALKRKAGRVVGVDSSGKMLEQAGQRMKDKGPVSLRLGTLEHLPMGDGEADFALCSMVLHHLADPAPGLADSFRALAPGGTLVVVELDKHELESMRTDFGDHWLGFSQEELEGWIQRAGFIVQDTARHAVRTEYTGALELGVHIITAHRPARAKTIPPVSIQGTRTIGG